MNYLQKAAAFVACLAIVGSAAPIANVQFKDLTGKSWDLYAELAKGKSVLVHESGAT